jgi:hypothetical protein
MRTLGSFNVTCNLTKCQLGYFQLGLCYIYNLNL